MTIWCKHVHRLELHFFLIFVLRIYQLGYRYRDELSDFLFRICIWSYQKAKIKSTTFLTILAWLSVFNY